MGMSMAKAAIITECRTGRASGLFYIGFGMAVRS